MGIVHTPRLLLAILRGMYKQKKARGTTTTATTTTSIGFGIQRPPHIYHSRVGFIDYALGHMNNAAFLSHAEYARTQMCAENGIIDACIRYKAGFVVTSSTLRFRQQLGPFGQAFQVETSLVKLDERNVWLLQNFRKKNDGGERCLSQVLVQTSLVEQGKVIDPRIWLVEKAHIDADVVDSVNLSLINDENSDDDERHVAMQEILDRSDDLTAALRKASTIDDGKHRIENRKAAARADQLLHKMEAKYLAGDTDLKPNTFTINALAKSGKAGAGARAERVPNTFTINALAKSGEAGAAARAERVLQNMVNRHRNNGSGGDNVNKPRTINFNTVIDAWAKSGGGRAAAERAEEILEWMDRLHKQGNNDVKPDTITFNAVLDAWAKCGGGRAAAERAEAILDNMDERYQAGNKGVKPDTFTYNTLINAWAKSGERGSLHELSMSYPSWRSDTMTTETWTLSGTLGHTLRSLMHGQSRERKAQPAMPSRY